MAARDYKTIAQYIAAQPQPARAALVKMRAAIRKALPRATEGISYQIPVYRIDDVMVLYMAGYARHLAIYPATKALVEALGDAGLDRLHHKATLRFPLASPLPLTLIGRIAKLRAAEVAAAKAGKPVSRRGSRRRPSAPRSRG